MYSGAAFVGRAIRLHTLFVLDTPGVKALPLWEIIRRLTANQPHGNLTLAPSLWPDRELRKYHYLLHQSSPPPGAARIIRIGWLARLQAGGSQRAYGLALGTGNVPDEWL